MNYRMQIQIFPVQSQKICIQKIKQYLGSSGVIQLELDFSDIETATSYFISLDTEKSKMPKNMKLYIDNSYNVEFSKYTGTTELGTDKIIRNIYWKWNYTTDDETNEWMKKELKITLDIEAEQRTN